MIEAKGLRTMNWFKKSQVKDLNPRQMPHCDVDEMLSGLPEHDAKYIKKALQTALDQYSGELNIRETANPKTIAFEAVEVFKKRIADKVETTFPNELIDQLTTALERCMGTR